MNPDAPTQPAARSGAGMLIFPPYSARSVVQQNARSGYSRFEQICHHGCVIQNQLPDAVRRQYQMRRRPSHWAAPTNTYPHTSPKNTIRPILPAIPPLPVNRPPPYGFFQSDAILFPPLWRRIFPRHCAHRCPNQSAVRL